MKLRKNLSTSSKKSSGPGIPRTLIFVLKLAVSSLSLYLVFSKVDVRDFVLMLAKIGPLFFLVAALPYILAQVLSTWRWKLLLPEHFRFGRLFSLYMIGSFFNSFLPGVIGGDAIKAYYLNKDAKKISLTLASVFMDRYFGYASLMIIGISAFPFAYGYFGPTAYRWIMPGIFVAFVAASFLFFGLKMGKRFNSVAEIYEYFGKLKSRQDVIVKAVLLSFVVQLLNFVMVIILALAMGENIPLIALFVFLPIIITVTTIPISVSGLGVREGSFVLLLGLINVRPEVATSLSLSWFLTNFLGGLPGLVAYIRHKEIKA
jgi:glycosyltransferase 2 family protein